MDDFRIKNQQHLRSEMSTGNADQPQYNLIEPDASSAQNAPGEGELQPYGDFTKITTSGDKKPTITDLRGGQALQGYKAIIFGAIMMVFGVGAGYQTWCYYLESTPAIRIGSCMIVSIIYLIGLLLFCSGIKSLLRKMKASALKNMKERWLAEFKGDPKEAFNASGAEAQKYLRNFLIGHVFFAPALGLGWYYFFAPETQMGARFCVVLVTAWYALGTYVTFRKLVFAKTSKDLKLRLKEAPFYLGEKAEMVLSNRIAGDELSITRVTLRCITEETVISGSSGTHRSVYRQAYELYREERECKIQTISLKGGLPLSFDLPQSDSLSTNLLNDDPIYWTLHLEGQNAFEPIDASFLLPVYRKKSK